MRCGFSEEQELLAVEESRKSRVRRFSAWADRLWEWSGGGEPNPHRKLGRLTTAVDGMSLISHLADAWLAILWVEKCSRLQKIHQDDGGSLLMMRFATASAMIDRASRPYFE